jgi:hypothetical protein
METQKEATIDWLLEPDEPGVRYLALRDLVQPAPALEVLRETGEIAHAQGPIATILAQMQPEGWWSEAGAGYNPKYYSTVWSVIQLAQLGAHSSFDERVGRACEYVLAYSLTKAGQFSTNGAPSGSVDCLQGNLCAALLDLGVEPERLDLAFEWMALTLTGEGIAPMSEKEAVRLGTAAYRYYAGKCGPNFACGANNKLPCAWGAAKVMLAFSKLTPDQRTPLIERAIRQGVDYLFSVDPATAAYPCGWAEKPSGNWWKFGFPVFYITDLLQLAEVLVGLGYKEDPRLANTLKLIGQKQDAAGRWPLEFEYKGKTWVEYGEKKQPNKWVTYRGLKVLCA